MALSKPIVFTRRNFLRGFGGAAIAGCAGVAYVRWLEPSALHVHHVRIPIARGPGEVAPVRIVHLSDLHASPVVPYAFIAEAVALAIAQRPDVIALTGDFFTNTIPDAPRFAEILRQLSAAAPTFACLGNHDGGPWTASAGGLATIDEAAALLREARITHLHNASEQLVVRDRTVHLFGVGDLWSGMCEPAKAFARASSGADTARVLLNHNPDAKEQLRPFDWHVLLCGHTHGGQLRLPFLGTPFAPVVDKRYVEGLHRWENRWLYITRGVGNLHGLRFNCRPQISVLELV